MANYQQQFVHAGIDWFHESGHLEVADISPAAVPPNFDKDTLRGLGLTIAIISDGVYDNHPNIAAIVSRPDDFNVVMDFANGDGFRGTAIAGVICGKIDGLSVGLAPKTAVIIDIPIFRTDTYNAFGLDHVDRVNSMILALSTAISSATADGADIIVIDYDYDIFSITAGVSQVALDDLKNALTATHAYVCLSTGEMRVEDDESILGLRGDYQLLDSRIPSIRSFVFMVNSAGILSQPIINATKRFSDVILSVFPNTGHGLKRMGTLGFSAPTVFDKYNADGSISGNAFGGSASSLAYFAGFLAVIRGFRRGNLLFSEEEGKRIARASVVFVPQYSNLPSLNQSTGYVDVYTGDGSGGIGGTWLQKQIYINGWSSLGGFGIPSFEILARIISNALAGCLINKSITSDPPAPDEKLPAVFQSVPGNSVNPFDLFNTLAYDGWPDLGPNGAPPFQGPADPAFVDRQCAIP